MNCNGTESKSRVIAQKIREAIRRGYLRPGEKLGSVRTLGEKFGVTRQVLCSAFEILAGEKLIYTEPCVGAFVCRKLPDGAVRRKLSIGFLCWKLSLSKSAPLRLYLTLLEQAREKMCEIFLNTSELETDPVAWANDYRLDGVIVYGYIDESLIRRLKDSSITFLAVGNYRINTPFNALESDIEGNLRRSLTELVRKKKFKRFFSIASHPDLSEGVRLTEEALVKITGELGIKCSESSFFRSETEDGYTGMKKFCSENKFSKQDILYITRDAFVGAARYIFESGLSEAERPFIYCDAAPDGTIPHSDLIDHFTYRTTPLTLPVLDAFLDIWFGRVKQPWRGFGAADIMPLV